MTTKELIRLARDKGITIKTISELTEINVNTLYNFSCGSKDLSKEKKEKINNILSFLIDT